LAQVALLILLHPNKVLMDQIQFFQLSHLLVAEVEVLLQVHQLQQDLVVDLVDQVDQGVLVEVKVEYYIVHLEEIRLLIIVEEQEIHLQ
jgi:hypothetical protein